MPRFRTPLLVAAIAGSALLLGAAPRALAAQPHPCTGAITAGGHQYVVHVDGVSCSVARKWAAVLAAKRLHAPSLAAPLSGGPGGFRCTGTTSQGYAPTGVAANVQVSGTCVKGGLTGPQFNWIVRAHG